MSTSPINQATAEMTSSDNQIAELYGKLRTATGERDDALDEKKAMQATLATTRQDLGALEYKYEELSKQFKALTAKQATHPPPGPVPVQLPRQNVGIPTTKPNGGGSFPPASAPKKKSARGPATHKAAAAGGDEARKAFMAELRRDYEEREQREKEKWERWENGGREAAAAACEARVKAEAELAAKEGREPRCVLMTPEPEEEL